MSEDQKNLLEKKQELETELEHIQKALDLSLDNVRNDMEDTINPVHFIRRHPLPVVAGSVLLGILIGHNRPDGKSKSHFTGALVAELKRLVTKKAVRVASEYVEGFLDNSSKLDRSASANGKR